MFVVQCTIMFVACSVCHHHHNQITKLSHSINAIGPAPHRGGRKREHRSIMFATIMQRMCTLMVSDDLARP
jgi:hypothetical protein